MSTIVTTFPIGLRDMKVKTGLIVLPAIADALGKILKCKFILPINTMDSFRERNQFAENYVKTIEQYGMSPSGIWHDEDHKNISTKIQKLIDNGFLVEKKEIVYICKCKRIEFVEGSFVEQNAKLFNVKSRSKYCLHCNSELLRSEEPVLKLTFPNNLSVPPVYPENNNKEIYAHIKKLENMEYLISRTRDTGVQVNVSGNMYYIDIDFCWLTMLSDLKAEKIILIGNHHVTWHMVLMYALERALNINHYKQIDLVLSPYIKENKGEFNIDLEREKIQENKELLLSYIFLNLAWKKQVSWWSKDYFELILKKNNKGTLKILNDYYNALSIKSPNLTTKDGINYLNRQKILSVLINKNKK